MDRRRQGAYGADAGQVQNLAGALAHHELEDRLGGVEQTVDVGVDYFVPGALGHRCEVVAPVDGRVVDQNVNATELFVNLAGHLDHSRSVGDRYFERERAAPHGFNLFDGGRGAFIADVEIGRDVGPFAREDFTQRAPDAARTACNNRFLSF